MEQCHNITELKGKLKTLESELQSLKDAVDEVADVYGCLGNKQEIILKSIMREPRTSEVFVAFLSILAEKLNGILISELKVKKLEQSLKEAKCTNNEMLRKQKYVEDKMSEMLTVSTLCKTKTMLKQLVKQSEPSLFLECSQVGNITSVSKGLDSELDLSSKLTSISHDTSDTCDMEVTDPFEGAVHDDEDYSVVEVKEENYSSGVLDLPQEIFQDCKVFLQSAEETFISEEGSNLSESISLEDTQIHKDIGTDLVTKSEEKKEDLSVDTKSFSSDNIFSNLNQRKRKSQSQRFSCDSCTKDYASDYALRLHKRSMHNGIKHLCEVCSQLFNNKKTLARHLIINHGIGKRKLYTCVECNRIFLEQFQYDGHMNSHNNVRPHACSKCPKTFMHQNNLRRHLKQCGRADALKPSCPECGMKFMNDRVLKDHINGKHTSKKYTCICSRTFSWRGSYSKHRLKCSHVIWKELESQ